MIHRCYKAYYNIIIINIILNKWRNNEMVDFSNKKTQKKIAGIIAGILVFAMVIGLLL